MNLGEIREEIRDSAADDVGEDDDRSWSDAEIDRYINRIYRKIASETLCIRDSTTVAVCRIDCTVVDYTTLVAGTQDYIWANDPDSWLYQKNVAPYLYPYHSSILKIEEAKWEKRPWKLTKVSASKFQSNPWWEQVIGQPIEYCTDLENKKIALNYRDTEDDVLRLTVRRLPITKLIRDNDIPEFKELYHDFFLNGVLSMMYRKQDTQAYDKKKADYHEVLFMDDLDEVKQQDVSLDTMLRPNHSMNAFR